MDIQEKQAKWNQERPLFEAEFIHSHLLPFFNFNENTGDYEIKSEFVEDEDRKLAYEILNTGWVMWLRAKRAKAQAVPEWISVKDQKPKALKNVLLSVKLKRKKNPLVCIGFYSQEPFEDPCFVLDDNFTELDNVTHWMHLPEALKTQEQNHV